MLFRYLRRFRTLLTLVNRAFGAYRSRIFLITLLTVVSGLLEGLGINAIIPLFSYMSGGPDARSDVISQFIDRMLRVLSITPTVKYILLFMIAVFLLKAFFLFMSQFVLFRTMVSYEKATMTEIFREMLKSNWTHLSGQKVGYLEHVVVTDVDKSSGILFHIGTTLVTLVTLSVYTILVINVSPLIASVALLFGLVSFLLFKPLFYKNRLGSERFAALYKQVAHFVNEHMIGMKTIKALHAEAPIGERGSSLFSLLNDTRFAVEMTKQLTMISLQPAALFFIVVIFAFFYKTKAFHIASFAVIVYAMNRIFVSLQVLQSEVHDFISRYPHLQSVLSYREQSRRFEEKNTGTRPFLFEKNLEFRGVDFFYREGAPILSHCQFTIQKGELVGLVGPSGVGKTTIVDMLLRLLSPHKGHVRLDGIPAEQIGLESWRRQIGYVAQEPFLLNDTIRNNIRFYDSLITDRQIRTAADMANMLDFILEQPSQFETLVGERGVRLSGGERQRIALARVLARQPSILVLDEATSALDSESEKLVQEAIENLRGKVTVVAIAHRLSTVQNFDRVLLLSSGGQVVEDGNPQDLLNNQSSEFYRLYYHGRL